MRLSIVSYCALLGSVASLYGIGVALMPMKTGLFELDISHLVADAKVASEIQTLMRLADGLSLRMLVSNMLTLALFVAIACLDLRKPRPAPSTE